MHIGVILALVSCLQFAASEKKPGIAQLCRLKLYSPENGKIDELKETKSGEFSATFECNPGYRMIGQKRIACINGHWVSRVPWCKSVCNFKKCAEGQKCVLDDVSKEAKCVCKKILECPFKYSPICASDHVTYASSCILGMASCNTGVKITKLSDGVCPKGLFQDASCSECPKIRICPALYRSQYAFLGKLSRLNATENGVYLNFKMLEVYKFGETKPQSKFITLYKKKANSECSCLPFVPSGKAYVFGQTGLDSSNSTVHLFDEHTYVEKFYSHKQISLCWLH